MVLTTKLMADYAELINSELDSIPIKTLADFLSAIKALKSIIADKDFNTSSPHLKDALVSIRQYLIEPELYVKEKQNYLEYQSIIRKRIQDKITEFEKMTTKQKQEYLNSRNKAHQNTLEIQKKLAEHKFRGESVLTEEQWHDRLEREGNHELNPEELLDKIIPPSELAKLSSEKRKIIYDSPLILKFLILSIDNSDARKIISLSCKKLALVFGASYLLGIALLNKNQNELLRYNFEDKNPYELKLIFQYIIYARNKYCRMNNIVPPLSLNKVIDFNYEDLCKFLDEINNILTLFKQDYGNHLNEVLQDIWPNYNRSLHATSIKNIAYLIKYSKSTFNTLKKYSPQKVFFLTNPGFYNYFKIDMANISQLSKIYDTSPNKHDLILASYIVIADENLTLRFLYNMYEKDINKFKTLNRIAEYFNISNSYSLTLDEFNSFYESDPEKFKNISKIIVPDLMSNRKTWQQLVELYDKSPKLLAEIQDYAIKAYSKESFDFLWKEALKAGGHNLNKLIESHIPKGYCSIYKELKNSYYYSSFAAVKEVNNIFCAFSKHFTLKEVLQMPTKKLLALSNRAAPSYIIKETNITFKQLCKLYDMNNYSYFIGKIRVNYDEGTPPKLANRSELEKLATGLLAKKPCYKP